MENDIPYFEDESSKMRPDLPIVERETVNAILWNPRTNEALCLDWLKFDWRTFVIGGVEEGESPEKAALREIIEETGYEDIALLSELGRLRSGYFAAHKGENRLANATGLLFELRSERRRDIDSASLPHAFVWMPRYDVEPFINLASQKYLWSRAAELLPKA